MGAFLKLHFADERYASLVDTVKRFAEGYDAADLDRVSAFALREEWQGTEEDDQYRPGKGYSEVLGFLKKQCEAQGVEFQFSSPVKNNPVVAQRGYPANRQQHNRAGAKAIDHHTG